MGNSADSHQYSDEKNHKLKNRKENPIQESDVDEMPPLEDTAKLKKKEEKKKTENELKGEIHFKKGNKFFNSCAYKKAIKEYNIFISLNPKDEYAFLNRGRSFVNIGKYEKGLEDFNSALGIDPEYFEALSSRADLYSDMGFHEEAISDYSEAIEYDGEDDEVYFNRALSYEKLKKYDLALKDYSSAIKFNHEDSSSYYNRGKVHEKVGEISKALEDYTEALRLKPDYYRALFNRATIFAKINENEKSLEDYSLALKMNPSDDEAFVNRASVFREEKRLDEAIYDYTEAIKLNHKNDRAYFNRAMVFSEKREYEDSVKDFSKYLKMKPQDTEALCNRGYCFKKLKRMDKAIRDFSSSIHLDKKFGIGFYNLGVCYEEINQNEKALEYHRIASSLLPNEPKVFCSLGVVYGKMKKYQEAIHEYSEAIRVNSNYFVGYSNRGICYQKLGEYEKAKNDFISGLKINPSDKYILCNLADLFLEVGEREESERHYKMAIERNPQKGFVYGRRMYSLQKIDEERALDDFTRILQLGRSEIEDDEEMVDVRKGDELPEVMRELYERMESKKLNSQLIKNQHYTFMNDLRRDECIEKEELSEIRHEIAKIFGKEGSQNPNVAKDVIQIFRFLGSGSFCRTYLCRIKHISGIYVLKIVKEKGRKRSYKSFEKERVKLPYHRNIVMNLSEGVEILQRFDARTFPDYEFWWKNEQDCSDDHPYFSTPIVLMRFCRKDLYSFVDGRKKNKSSFGEEELARMLYGLLDGVNHLHNYKIVHRDLHIGNVFVDEVYGRIYIGDFGCSLDFRNKDGFKVSKTDKFVMTLYYSTEELVKGGPEMYMPPEILDTKKTSKFLDFEKYDLFSVGMIGYYIDAGFRNDFAPFGMNDDEGYPISSARKMSNYRDLLNFSPEMNGLIKGMLQVDPNDRLDYSSSLKIALEIKTNFELTQKQ